MNAAVKRKSSGFTIVELLVVIVVIGILAAIAIVSYSGITSKATGVSLQSDLSGASKKLKMFMVEHGHFPTGNNCSNPTNEEICLTSSQGNVLAYTPAGGASPQTYSLTATKSSVTYVIDQNSAPSLVAALICPTGFIPVPGSATYGTSNFCVMKYEARNAGGNVPISQAAGLPWLGMSQANAATYSTTVAGCTGCHLITDAEWMTIAQNVLGVASNWSSGVVGSGYIFAGHCDYTPAGIIAADENDNNGYANTGESSGITKRTLTLSNGEVIWDLSGNLQEFTSGTMTTGKPGTIGTYTFREWPTIVNLGTMSPNPSPAGTGIAGSDTWNSTNGVGMLLSDPNDTTIRTSVVRGGICGAGCSSTGILRLQFNNPSGYADIGFRVAK